MKKSKIIKFLNTSFGVDLSVDDEAAIVRLQTNLQEDKELRRLFNSKEGWGYLKFKFDDFVDDLLLNLISTKIELYFKLSKPEVNMFFKSILFETCRQQATIN